MSPRVTHSRPNIDYTSEAESYASYNGNDVSDRHLLDENATLFYDDAFLDTNLNISNFDDERLELDAALSSDEEDDIGEKIMQSDIIRSAKRAQDPTSNTDNRLTAVLIRKRGKLTEKTSTTMTTGEVRNNDNALKGKNVTRTMKWAGRPKKNDNNTSNTSGLMRRRPGRPKRSNQISSS
ncbi:hypothetical protein INT45_006481 [Circinella minor]|uniref:Uncharacterized protein n=1 Tax=Circinella minor TaxID=1195481 RepID=A0A8H7RKN2_9FUNG|nr:hypothetical protein INT45_006481 [Circinella minor]